MDLVNAPANKKRPQDLADWAVASGERFGYNVSVLDKGRCEVEGMHALLAVNRGSEDPARFVIMEYKGENSPERPTVIIGKGVTFDTGGISIKGSTNLHLMKSDMGGAAAVFGTLETSARLQLPVNLVGLVPLTDNSVDALAIKPSDVIGSHSGKTIEIIDTDAEGRLIMCDALSYGVKHYDAETLIDIATLTGSAVRTFGYACAALFSKNEELVSELRRAGERSGERCWPLPMWEEYRSGLDSDVADIKNYSGKPINGAIDAAMFLEFFTQEHPRFAHLDIAGVALKAGAYAKDRMATGFGIGLLTAFLQRKN
jgi:leucyl aminopeptidase